MRHIVAMQILINHIGYILMTLAVGVVIGWSTYPALNRMSIRVRERAEVDRRSRGSGR